MGKIPISRTEQGSRSCPLCNPIYNICTLIFPGSAGTGKTLLLQLKVLQLLKGIAKRNAKRTEEDKGRSPESLIIIVHNVPIATRLAAYLLKICNSPSINMGFYSPSIINEKERDAVKTDKEQVRE